MKTITLTLENEIDYQLLVQLITRLGIVWQETPTLTTEQLAYHKKVIEKGGKMTYIGDVVKWQREQRQSRELPFHELKGEHDSIR